MRIPATEAKRKFGQILMQAQNKPVFIEKNGTTTAIVISKHLYDMYEEAVDLLQQRLERDKAKTQS